MVYNNLMGNIPLILLAILCISLFSIIDKWLDGINKRHAGRQGERKVASTVTYYFPSFKVIRNLYVPQGEGRSTEIDVVLVHKSGIYVLEVKNYTGWIYGSENQRYWTKVHYKEKHQFYNPLMQNIGHIRSLQRYLRKDIEIFHSYIVFTGDCELKSVTINSIYHRVITRGQLESQIQCDSAAYGTLLSDEEVTSIYNSLLPLANPSRERKEEQVRTYQTAKAKDDDSGGRCPLCGGHLVARRNKSTGNPFWGCSNYPRCRYTRNYADSGRGQSGRAYY